MELKSPPPKKVGETTGCSAEIRCVTQPFPIGYPVANFRISGDIMSAQEIIQVSRVVEALHQLLGDKLTFEAASVVLEVMKEEDLTPEAYCQRLKSIPPAVTLGTLKALTGEPNNWRQHRQIIWWRTSKEGVDTIRLASRGRSFKARLRDAIRDQ